MPTIASSKINIGQTAEAYQYNDLRKDSLHAAYYAVDNVDNDSIFTVSNQIIGDSCAVKFKGGKISTCYWNLELPPILDTTLDLSLRIAFDMETASAGKQARMELKYASMPNTGDTTPSLTTILENVATPDTAETLKVVTLSTIRIPSASIADGNVVSFQLSRLGNDGNDTHSGNLRIFEIHLYQTQT